MKYPITANRLRKAMNDMWINAANLEQKSGVSKSSISHYFNGTHKPSNVAAEALARILCVNPLWLMGFDVPEDRTYYLYTLLDVEDQGKVHGYIEGLIAQDKYKKDTLEGGEVG